MREILVFWATNLLATAAFAVACPSGFDDVTSDFPATFYGKNGDFCPNGYEPYSAPSTLWFKFNGLVLDNGPMLCGSGSHYVNGECVAYAQENCDSGFYKNTENSATFYGKNGDLCPSGYEPYTPGSNLEFIFNGLVLANAPTVCASGYYVNGVCTARSGTGCITGYVDAGTDGVIAAVDANGSCPSGYNALWQYQSCTATTTDNICTTLCNGGMLQTAAGYCSEVCGNSLSVLHVGPTLTFPLYGTKTTFPSLVVGNESGQCYVNLAPGNASGAINVRYNNTVYHTTD